MISDLALELGAKLNSSDTTKTRLVGQGLVWGVRDDTVLASFGYSLPSTGGTPAQKSVLAGHGPIVAAEPTSLSRRTFLDKGPLAAYDVRPIKQPTSMGCWATVYAMLKSWKEGRDLTVAKSCRHPGRRLSRSVCPRSGSCCRRRAHIRQGRVHGGRGSNEPNVVGVGRNASG